MIDIDELRSRQAEFEGTRQGFKRELKKLEEEREQFLKKFPQKRIPKLALSKYALGGNRSEESFCYWLENRLKGLGNIHGATAFKFGIYFGRTKSDPIRKYRFRKKFGNDKDEAFQKVKEAIINLLDAAKKEDIGSIRENPLSPMFKGKILSTYYPDKYLNIFANEHLEYFLDKLKIPYEEAQDEIDKRQLLIDFKNKDEVMSEWTIYEFSKFLYDSFGRPSRKENAPEALKEYIESSRDYPKIKEVNAEFVDLRINPENPEVKTGKTKRGGRTIDFEKENKNHKLLGNRGELIVFNLEKQYLRDIGRKDLAEKIDWVSKRDDSLGYDILSFEETGEEKYIEVKATKQSPDSQATFLISSNQYEKAKKLSNYYFYVVFNAKSTTPKVWKIKNPLNYENNGLTLTPINYRVAINTLVKR